jgi:hypothetical protein
VSDPTGEIVPCVVVLAMREYDVASPIAKSLNEVRRLPWMLVGVREATTTGAHVGELNLRSANALVFAPASTSEAGT